MIESQPEETVIYGDLVVGRSRHEVLLAGRPIALTPREFDILWLLLSEPGRVFSREQVRTVVWTPDVYIDIRTVDVHVAKLRRKLNRGRKRSMVIETVWGRRLSSAILRSKGMNPST